MRRILKNLDWLSDYDGRRDNNFTLIRLILAWSVLFGHSWAVTGAKWADPISWLFRGYSWVGAVAVDGFFVISGFLVAGSFARHGPVGYLIARILRIFPALIVCVLLSVFVLGLWQTSLSAGAYLAATETHGYLGNMLLWPRIHWYLPGVFEDHPNKAVNGSLWTLPAEAACYMALLGLGFFGVLDSRLRANAGFAALCLIGLFWFPSLPIIGPHASWARPMGFFVLGAAIWVNRSTIPLHLVGAVLAVVLPALLMKAGVSRPVFFAVFAPCFAYCIFFAAYRLPHVNLDRLGDYSYGIYIYAWPCQQIAFWPDQSPWANAALATAMVLPMAALSWHLIERPALFLWRQHNTHLTPTSATPSVSFRPNPSP